MISFNSANLARDLYSICQQDSTYVQHTQSFTRQESSASSSHSLDGVFLMKIQLQSSFSSLLYTLSIQHFSSNEIRYSTDILLLREKFLSILGQQRGAAVNARKNQKLHQLCYFVRSERAKRHTSERRKSRKEQPEE